MQTRPAIQVSEGSPKTGDNRLSSSNNSKSRSPHDAAHKDPSASSRLPQRQKPSTAGWKQNLALTYHSPKACTSNPPFTPSLKWQPISCTNSTRKQITLDLPPVEREVGAIDRKSDPEIKLIHAKRSPQTKNKHFNFDKDSLLKAAMSSNANKQVVSCKNTYLTGQPVTPGNRLTDGFGVGGGVARKMGPLDFKTTHFTPKSSSALKNQQGNDFRVDQNGWKNNLVRFESAKGLRPLNIKAELPDLMEPMSSGNDLALETPDKFMWKLPSQQRQGHRAATKSFAPEPRKAEPSTNLFKKKSKKTTGFVASFKGRSNPNSAAAFFSSDLNTPVDRDVRREVEEPTGAAWSDLEKQLRDRLTKLAKEMKLKTDSYNRIIESKEEAIQRLESERETVMAENMTLAGQLDVQTRLTQVLLERLRQREGQPTDLSQLLDVDRMAGENSQTLSKSQGGHSSLHESEIFRLEDSPAPKPDSRRGETSSGAKTSVSATFAQASRVGYTPKMSAMQGKQISLYSPNPLAPVPPNPPTGSSTRLIGFTPNLAIDIEEEDETTFASNRQTTEKTIEQSRYHTGKMKPIEVKDSIYYNSAKKAVGDFDFGKHGIDPRAVDRLRLAKPRGALNPSIPATKAKVQSTSKPDKKSGKPIKRPIWSESFNETKDTTLAKTDPDARTNPLTSKADTFQGSKGFSHHPKELFMSHKIPTYPSVVTSSHPKGLNLDPLAVA